MKLQENISRIKEVMGLITEQVNETPLCSSSGCKGKYTGPEFNDAKNHSDIAHQYSNVITKAVAAQLKKLYLAGEYSKVDFGKIKMETTGKGSGNVVFTVDIPFERVNNKCDAMTGFGHSGSWSGIPELTKRKSELIGYKAPGKTENMILGDKLYISPITTTPEGLKEYWIQWKHRDYQSDCENNVNVTPNSEKIVITAKDIEELRENLKKQTQNISIDPTSIEVDMENYQVSFSKGNKKITVISLLFDNKGNMDERLSQIKKSNPTLEVIEKGETNGYQWVLSTI